MAQPHLLWGRAIWGISGAEQCAQEFPADGVPEVPQVNQGTLDPTKRCQEGASLSRHLQMNGRSRSVAKSTCVQSCYMEQDAGVSCLYMPEASRSLEDA